MTMRDGPWGNAHGFGGDPWLEQEDEAEPPCERCGRERMYPQPEACVFCGLGDPEDEQP